MSRRVDKHVNGFAVTWPNFNRALVSYLLVGGGEDQLLFIFPSSDDLLLDRLRVTPYHYRFILRVILDVLMGN